MNDTLEIKNTKALMKFPVLAEILFGIIFGLLNTLFSVTSAHIGLPLYFDTIFTAAGSFIGWWAGIIAALTFHFISIISTNAGQWSGFVFILCSLSMIPVIRLYLKNKTEIRLPDLMIIWALCALFMSFTGAVVYTFIFAVFDYQECVSTRYMTYVLLQQRIPVLLSSFISRIPVNCLDKAISVFGGFGVYKFICNYKNKKNAPEQK